jgi:hypothetical protein
MRSSSLPLSIVLVGGLLCGGGARAGYMDWSYRWSISPAPVLASGTGTVSQALGQPGMGASHILAAAVTTSSDAPANNPDRYNQSFRLTLHLMDRHTHQSGSLTFYGTIYGTVTFDSAHLTESFRTPVEYLRLGRHIYEVELPHYMRLMPPGSLVVPTYFAWVRVWNILPPPPPRVPPRLMAASVMMASIAAAPPTSAATPEPTGLILGGLGAALLACSALWRIWG